MILKLLLFVVGMATVSLLAIPVFVVCNAMLLFASGKFSLPEGHFMLACGVWFALAGFEVWMYRAFGSQPITGANVAWYFGITGMTALLVVLISIYVGDTFQMAFGEFGMGLLFMYVGTAGVVLAGTFFQLLRFVVTGGKSQATIDS